MTTTPKPKEKPEEESPEPSSWDLIMGAEPGTPITVGGDGSFPATEQETPVTAGEDE